MTNHCLKVEPLTKKLFEEFGQVVELEKHKDIKIINYGQTQRFNDLAHLDLSEADGKPLFSIFKSKPIDFPFKVKVIERHPLSSQLFFPLSNNPFLILVAKNAENPTYKDLRLFLSNGFQGVNYAANTWHHYLLASKNTGEFVVVDRGGSDKNCEEYFFTEDITIDQF